MPEVTSIARDEAVALFIALGFKTAAKWSNDRIQTKLAQVHTKVDADEELEDETAQETLNTVLEASEAGNDFEVEGEAPAAASKKKAAKKPAKKAAKKAAKPASKKAAAKKPAGKKKEATGDGRPRAGTSTGKVWDVCDKLQKKYTKKNKTVPRKEVVAACVEEGVNKSTAGVQFGKWCAANGLAPKNS